MRTMLAGILLLAGLDPALAQVPAPPLVASRRIYQLPPVGSVTGSEAVPIDGPSFTTGKSISLDAIAVYVGGKVAPLPPIALSGPALIPQGSNRICATPGSNLTLPAGVPIGTTEEVQDCAGILTSAAPITVYPAFDAPIAERSPYPLSIPYQAMGFRKEASGAWQPY